MFLGTSPPPLQLTVRRECTEHLTDAGVSSVVSGKYGIEPRLLIATETCGCNSGVEFFVANEVVAGSNPVIRSTDFRQVLSLRKL